MNFEQHDAVYGNLPKVVSREICDTLPAYAKALRIAKSAIFASVDIETIPYKKASGKKHTPELAKPEHTGAFGMTVVAYSFLLPDYTIVSFCIPLLRSKSLTAGPVNFIEQAVSTIRAINELPVRWTLQNGTYDCGWFIFYDMPLANYAYDSMTLFWAKWPDLPKRLDFITSVLLDSYQYWKGDRKSEDYVEYMTYAMRDTEFTLLNTMILLRLAQRDKKMLGNFNRAHMRCLAALGMSAMGLAVVEERVDEIHVELEAEAQAKKARVQYLSGIPGFNPNSVPQRKLLIYTLLKARPRTAKGRFVNDIAKASTGANALRSMRSEHPLFRYIINALLDSVTPAKQISNVVKLPRFAGGSTGSRLITSYDGTGTTTERLSSRGAVFGHGSNIQNIRKEYRTIARADEGCVYVEVDLGAADDVFVAYESEEPKKIELIKSGRDTHAVNALIFFSNWTYEAIVNGKHAKDPRVVHPITGVRQITKKVVHGCHYLMAALTLLMSAGREAIVAAAIELGHADANLWDQDQLMNFCASLEHKFREYYPRFKRIEDSKESWYWDLQQELIQTGGFMTAFGYFKRFLTDVRSDAALRAVSAIAGQAGTAGRINMIMSELAFGAIPRRFRDGPNPHANEIPRRISELRNGTTLRTQTHDSIGTNINLRHRHWEEGLESIFETFRRPVVVKGREFVVGSEADISIRWAGKESIQISSVEDAHAAIEKFIAAGYL